jgi:tetratricopeptide (TPR) repeat protein
MTLILHKKTLYILLVFTIIFSLQSLSGRDPIKDAKEAIAQGDYHTALTKLRDAYEERENRKNYEVNFLFATVFAQLNQQDSAEIYFYKVINISADSTAPFIGLGESYEKRNLNTMAIQQYEKAINLDSTNVAIHYKMAKLYRTQRDYKNAANSYLQVVKRDTMNTEALTELADIYTRAKQYPNAARLYKRLSTLKPDDFSIKISLLTALVSAKSTAEAIPVAEEIVAKDSTNIDIQRILSNAYYDTRNYSAAEIKLLFLQLHDTLETDEILMLAKTQLRLQKNADAATSYENFIIKHGEDATIVDIFKTLAELYMSAQNYEKAIENFQRRIKYDSTATSAYMNTAICKMQLKDFKGAENFLLQVTSHNPEYIKGHLYLARNYAQMDKPNEEGIAYKKVIELIADSTEKFKAELSEAYGFDGYIKFVTGSKLPNDKPEDREKIYSDAVKSLKKALEFDDISIQNNLLLAQLYQNMNKREEAIKQYRKVLKLDPNNKEAKKGLEILTEPKKQ